MSNHFQNTARVFLFLIAVAALFTAAAVVADEAAAPQPASVEATTVETPADEPTGEAPTAAPATLEPAASLDLAGDLSSQMALSDCCRECWQLCKAECGGIQYVAGYSCTDTGPTTCDSNCQCL